MNVKINDTAIELPAGATLADALQLRDIKTQGIAVAVNNQVVAKGCYESHTLQEGDSVIIIKAFYGG